MVESSTKAFHQNYISIFQPSIAHWHAIYSIKFNCQSRSRHAKKTQFTINNDLLTKFNSWPVMLFYSSKINYFCVNFLNNDERKWEANNGGFSMLSHAEVMEKL